MFGFKMTRRLSHTQAPTVSASVESRNLETTGSPSSKYEHRRTSTLCLGKKPIVSVTYEKERISINNSLPYLKCVLRLSCVVHGPIYDRFMGFHVNDFLYRYVPL